MRRALKTIPFVLQLQSEGSSIERLYKKGMLTDNMHFKVKELKTFIDEEFQEIQLEAENLLPGWGQIIWPQAMQFHQMIQKQTEDKSEDQKAGDEDKKKVINCTLHAVETEIILYFYRLIIKRRRTAKATRKRIRRYKQSK